MHAHTRTRTYLTAHDLSVCMHTSLHAHTYNLTVGVRLIIKLLIAHSDIDLLGTTTIMSTVVTKRLDERQREGMNEDDRGMACSWLLKVVESTRQRYS